MKLLGREPALWVSVLVSAVFLVATLGFDWLSPVQAGVVAGLVTAVAAAIFTRPIAPGLFTGLVTAAVAALGSYGFHFADTTVSALTAFVLVLFSLVTREQVSPVDTAVTNGKPAPVVNR